MTALPFEIFKVPGKDAVEQALRWREEWRGSFTPVILGGDEYTRVQERLEESNFRTDEIVRASKKIDLTHWFENRIEEMCSFDEEEDEISLMESITNPEHWNIDPGLLEILSVKKIGSSEFRSSMSVVKIPTDKAYETPAHLKLGGWNECSLSEEQVAVWRYWQEKYGAEILCTTPDVIEATVQRPPTTKEACYALAREQFAYCSDIVTQGVETIDALAATVRNGPYWYFWWD